MMKTILITGGAGFMGSNFVRYVYDKYPNYKILVIDALTYAASVENLPVDALGTNRYEFWYGNINNSELMDSLVSQVDYVVHFAAESHVTRSIYDNRLFFETDVLGTQTVANAVAKHRNRIQLFIHISTSEVYGTAKQELMDENHPLDPMSPYAAAKCGADRLVYSYWETYQIPAAIVRPFNNYGPRQHLEKLVPRFVTSCLLKEPLTVHGDGSASRDWLYVKDLCRALDDILHAEREKVAGQIINLGTGRSISVLEIANIIRKNMNCENVSVQFIGDRPGQVFRHTCNPEKVKQLVGWSPKIPFEEGILKAIEWYANHREWWTPQMWLRHIPIITAAGKKELH